MGQHVNCFMASFLPPASEGWRKVMFSLCPPFRGGGDVPRLRSGWGRGYPIPGLDRGYPIQGLDRGNPHPGLRCGQGGTPGTTPYTSGTWTGGTQGTPSPGWGTPLVLDVDGWGVPWHGVPPCPCPRSGWGTPPTITRMGYSPSAGWCTSHHHQDGVPPPSAGWGTPHWGQDRGEGTPTGTEWRVLATRRVVCLLRSCRRTLFLFIVVPAHWFIHQSATLW